MARTSAQRGSLMSSVVMVMLATVATGLLALIGFQALPDGVVSTTFGGGDHKTRRVDVSESPFQAAPVTQRPAPTVDATSAATSAPTAQRTTEPPRPFQTATAPNGGNGTGTGGNDGGTVPQPVKTSSATTQPTKKPTPPPTTKPPAPPTSQATQAPSPAPTCGSGRKPRCSTPAPTQDPKAAPTTEPTTRSLTSSSSTSSPTAYQHSSSTTPTDDAASEKPAKKGTAKKAQGTRGAKR